MTTQTEVAQTFACFGSTCGAHVMGEGPAGDPADAVAAVRRRLLDWHGRFTRFSPSSELSVLNDDRRAEVAVTPFMARFVEAAVGAAYETGGLVDPTLLRPLEDLGYRGESAAPLSLDLALRLTPVRAPAAPAARAAWRDVVVDRERSTVTRPPGVALDSGGIAKGLFADVLAEDLDGCDAFAVDCGGDLRLGGVAGRGREVRVESPHDGRILHTYALVAGGVATSGIGRRSWLGTDGRAKHHLLNPATGRPAFTGIVQVTALAPTALRAEIRAKAALLTGPAGARRWLPDGGVVVYDDGAFDVVRSTLLTD
jgi:thiamine biosynthesis lipoprotein